MSILQAKTSMHYRMKVNCRSMRTYEGVDGEDAHVAEARHKAQRCHDTTKDDGPICAGWIESKPRCILIPLNGSRTCHLDLLTGSTHNAWQECDQPLLLMFSFILYTLLLDATICGKHEPRAAKMQMTRVKMDSGLQVSPPIISKYCMKQNRQVLRDVRLTY